MRDVRELSEQSKLAPTSCGAPSREVSELSEQLKNLPTDCGAPVREVSELSEQLKDKVTFPNLTPLKVTIHVNKSGLRVNLPSAISALIEPVLLLPSQLLSVLE